MPGHEFSQQRWLCDPLFLLKMKGLSPGHWPGFGSSSGDPGWLRVHKLDTSGGGQWYPATPRPVHKETWFYWKALDQEWEDREMSVFLRRDEKGRKRGSSIIVPVGVGMGSLSVQTSPAHYHLKGERRGPVSWLHPFNHFLPWETTHTVHEGLERGLTQRLCRTAQAMRSCPATCWPLLVAGDRHFSRILQGRTETLRQPASIWRKPGRYWDSERLTSSWKI